MGASAQLNLWGGALQLFPASAHVRRRSAGRVRDFVSALAIVAAATLVRLVLDPLVDNQAVYVIYTGALVVIAATCGRSAAVFGMVVAAFTANYLFVPPRYEFLPHGQDWVAMAVFSVVASGAIWLVGRWKRAEETVRDRMEELQAILNTAPAGVFVTRDRDARRIDGNEMAYRLFRTQPGANLSLTAPEHERPATFRSMKSGRDLRGEELPMQRAMAGKGPVLDYDFDVVYTDGSARTLFGNAAALFDKDGNVRGAVGTFLDITERKRAEEAMRDANRLKDEFLATLSHELRTPLNAIVGWADLLRTGSLDADAAGRAVESIHRNAKAQDTLINDVLDVSRIVRGRLEIDCKPLNVIAEIESAVDAVRPAAEAKGVGIETDYQDGPVSACADAARLRQVFWNLLANAIKFTPAGGRVRVSARAAADEVVVAVADTGIGITRQFLPHVFDRFRQRDSSITRRHSGLGLGLAIVRHLVELHGGTVRAESPGEGRGASFTVSLPLGPVERSPGRRCVPAIEQAPDELPSLRGVEVLVVDDEPEARQVATAVLQYHGAKVKVAGNAEQAVRQFDASAPDVLLLDIAMPDVDGYTLLRRLRALGPETAPVPAIALTALAREEDRLRSLSSGFQLHLSKPIDSLTLVRAVAGVCRA